MDYVLSLPPQKVIVNLNRTLLGASLLELEEIVAGSKQIISPKQ